MRRGVRLGIAAALAGPALVAFVAWEQGQVPAPRRATAARPNVVLISMDTTRPDHLSCYGYPRKTSPNLERLAARGLRYTNARSQAPWTLPSHMTLFTSLIPSHHHVNVLNSVLAPEVPLLAEILRDAGYNTAGVVNNGEMKSVWGFDRGFGLWEEYRSEDADSDCVHLTDRALEWLGSGPAEPFFLFLHYYDPHDVYDPPEPFRERFGATLPGAENSRIIHRLKLPAAPIGDRAQFDQVVGAYDGEIAWLDHELGRLFAHLPENTLVVVFSDHGEAFKEHGWALHGATLYEEAVRVVLLISLPGVLPPGEVVNEPVMLLDVAPTILSLCGVSAPGHYEGLDLRPTWGGGRLPERPILSETLTSVEGTGFKMVALKEWKLIRSLFDGREELYRLPDEQTDRAGQEGPVRKALSDVACRWVEEEEFWTVHVHGPGEFTVFLAPRSGPFRNIVAMDAWRGGRDNETYQYEPAGRHLLWRCTPGDRTRGMYFQLAAVEAPVLCDVRIAGAHQPAAVFVGSTGAHPGKLPFDLAVDEAAASSPVIDRPFAPERPGCYLFRHRARRGTAFPARGTTLDDETVRQLRGLGYLR